MEINRDSRESDKIGTFVKMPQHVSFSDNLKSFPQL